MYQWIEYAYLFVAPAAKNKHVAQSMLKEFNCHLSTRSYLVGTQLTVADLAIYFAIQQVMVSSICWRFKRFKRKKNEKSISLLLGRLTSHHRKKKATSTSPDGTIIYNNSIWSGKDRRSSIFLLYICIAETPDLMPRTFYKKSKNLLGLK